MITYKVGFLQEMLILRYKYSRLYLPENMLLEYCIDKTDLNKLKTAISFLLQNNDILRCRISKKNEDFFFTNDVEYSVDELFESTSEADYNATKIKCLNYNIDIFKGPLLRIFLNSESENSKINIIILFNQLIYDQSCENTIYKYLNKYVHENSSIIIGENQYENYCKEFNDPITNERAKKYWQLFFSNVDFSEVAFYTDTCYPYKNQKNIPNGYSSYLENQISLYSKNEKDVFSKLNGKQCKLIQEPGGELTIIKDYEFIQKIKLLASKYKVTEYIIHLFTAKVILYYISNNKLAVIGNCISLKKPNDDVLGFFSNIIFSKFSMNDHDHVSYMMNKILIQFYSSYKNSYYSWEKILLDNNIDFNSISNVFIDYADMDKPIFNLEHTPVNMYSYKDQAGSMLFDIDLFILKYKEHIEFKCLFKHHLYNETNSKNYLNLYFACIDSLLIVSENSSSSLSDLFSEIYNTYEQTY